MGRATYETQTFAFILSLASASNSRAEPTSACRQAQVSVPPQVTTSRLHWDPDGPKWTVPKPGFPMLLPLPMFGNCSELIPHVPATFHGSHGDSSASRSGSDPQSGPRAAPEPSSPQLRPPPPRAHWRLLPASPSLGPGRWETPLWSPGLGGPRLLPGLLGTGQEKRPAPRPTATSRLPGQVECLLPIKFQQAARRAQRAQRPA